MSRPRIRQKPAHHPHRDQLDSKSQTVVQSPAAINYRQISIVQSTEPLKILKKANRPTTSKTGH